MYYLSREPKFPNKSKRKQNRIKFLYESVTIESLTMLHLGTGDHFLKFLGKVGIFTASQFLRENSIGGSVKYAFVSVIIL